MRHETFETTVVCAWRAKWCHCVSRNERTTPSRAPAKRKSVGKNWFLFFVSSVTQRMATCGFLLWPRFLRV